MADLGTVGQNGLGIGEQSASLGTAMFGAAVGAESAIPPERTRDVGMPNLQAAAWESMLERSRDVGMPNLQASEHALRSEKSLSRRRHGDTGMIS